MEGKETYKAAYDYLNTLCKKNLTNNIDIDYNKLDSNSEEILRKLIDNFIRKRKAEIFTIIQKCEK